MKFRTLKIANFGSITEVELPLCDQGLTLLLGRNEDAPKADSNGAGKSLPLDAFTWALWGSTVRGFSTDDVIHRKIAKDCKVQLFLEEDGHKYEVRRYRRNKADKQYKTNDLVLLCDGLDVSGGSVAATEEAIESIVGLDFATFCAMMPGAGVSVAAMTDAEVKTLLERLLRTEALSKASDEARKRSRTVSDSLLTSTTSLRDLENRITDLKERIVTLKTQEATHSEDVKTKVTELDLAIEAAIQERAVLHASVSFEPMLSNRLTSILGEASSKRNRISTYKETIKDLKTDCRSKVKQEEIYISFAEEKLQKSVDSIAGIQSSENKCPVCSQRVGDSAIEAMQDHQDADKKVADEHKAAIKELNNKALRDLDIVTKALYEDEASLKQDNKIIVNLEADLKQITGDKSSLTVLNGNLSLLEKSRHDHKFSANPYASLLASDESKLIENIASKAKKESNILALQEKADILSFWVESFSPSGIRSFMLEHVVPILDHHAKAYSDLITDGEMSITFHTKDTLKSGKSKEKFNIKVTQKSGGDSYVSNSSGERARANLIIALALGELASLRAEKSIPFRFLDEPFESIDESGTEAIVTLLNQQKDKYNTVYVITHQDSLKQMFQNKKTIVKKNGYSTMEN
jgi:DNA repair exonuclease SbcCD ATPase subunit